MTSFPGAQPSCGPWAMGATIARSPPVHHGTAGAAVVLSCALLVHIYLRSAGIRTAFPAMKPPVK
jgi:hypothetical protein